MAEARALLCRTIYLVLRIRRHQATQDADWFAIADTRPLASFASIRTSWHGKRGTKANPVEGEHQLFGFLTTDANAEVGAIHPKAMPVILITADDVERWLTLPTPDALPQQRPLPDGALNIVAQGEKEDGAVAA